MRSVCALLSITCALIGCDRTPEPVASNHPVLGAWKLDIKDGGCSEIYRFRPDNSVLITSGDEVSEVRSKLAASPSAEGFYRWDHTVVKDNGQRDCAGNVMKVGDSGTWFVQLSATGDRLIFCEKPSTAACFGPLRRIS